MSSRVTESEARSTSGDDIFVINAETCVQRDSTFLGETNNAKLPEEGAIRPPQQSNDGSTSESEAVEVTLDLTKSVPMVRTKKTPGRSLVPRTFNIIFAGAARMSVSTVMQDTGPEQISEASSNQPNTKPRVIAASSFDTEIGKYEGAVLAVKAYQYL